MVNLAITNRCNYRCHHCCFKSGELEVEELPIEKLGVILSDLRAITNKLEITGGEPLLRADLEEIVKISKTLGYQVKILTNGSLLTKDRLSSLKGLDAVGISLDGSTYKIHNKIRNTDEQTFSKVLENLTYAASTGLFVKVNTVATKSNMADLPNITKLCTELGVKEHRICYFSPNGRGKDLDEMINPAEWIKFVKNYPKYSNVFFGFLDYINGPCILDEFPLHIMSNGDVYACSVLASNSKPIGNIAREKISDILSRPIKPCGAKACPLRKYSLEEVYENSM